MNNQVILLARLKVRANLFLYGYKIFSKKFVFRLLLIIFLSNKEQKHQNSYFMEMTQ